ncbi:hypothetical protein QTP88_015043 [Uroleucon formosanum]
MKKGDTKMVQNYENKNNDLVTSEVDKFHYEISGDNDEYLYKDTTMDSDFIRDEFTRKNPIDNALDGDWICKKKKKKKGDTKMVQNYENKNNDLVTSEVDKFHYEISGDNDEYLYKDTTMDSDFIRDEFTRKYPIANALEGDWIYIINVVFYEYLKVLIGVLSLVSILWLLLRMLNSFLTNLHNMIYVQNDKHLENDQSIFNVEQFYNETIDDNVKYLNKINISAFNFNKEDFTRRLQITNASENDKVFTMLKSPLKKVKQKKKKSKIAINVGTESSKYVTVQKNHKNMEYPKENISEEWSNEILYGKICIFQKCLFWN